MILKILHDNKYAVSFIEADEFKVHIVNTTGFMNDYKSVATNSQEEEKFRYNHMLYKLQEKTGMNHAYMRFETKTKYENLNLVIIISPFSKNKEHDIIVTDHTTYIMTDDGKTIEKIF